MANELKDVLRVNAAEATLDATIRNKQIGMATDTFRLGANFNATLRHYSADEVAATYTAKRTIQLTTDQLRLAYSAGVYSDIGVAADGDLQVTIGATPAATIYGDGTGKFSSRFGIGGEPDATAMLKVTGSLNLTSTLYAPSIGTGEDNSVLILDSDGFIKTDEIDSRVWGSTLIAKTDLSASSPLSYNNGTGEFSHLDTAGNKHVPTGTPDRVPYWSASGVLSAGSIHDNGSRVGIGISSPDCLLHVYSSNASQTADASSTLCLESSGHNYLSILSGASHECGLLFGDSGNNGVGQLLYNHGSDSMLFITNATEWMRLTHVGRVGIGITSPDCLLHVYSSDASQTANVNSTLCLESSGHNYLSILSGAAHECGVRFGDSGSDGAGQLIYNHGTNAMSFITNSTERMFIYGGGTGKFNSRFGIGGEPDDTAMLKVTGGALSVGHELLFSTTRSVGAGGTSGSPTALNMAGVTIVVVEPTAANQYYDFSDGVVGQVVILKINGENLSAGDMVYFVNGVGGYAGEVLPASLQGNKMLYFYESTWWAV